MGGHTVPHLGYCECSFLQMEYVTIQHPHTSFSYPPPPPPQPRNYASNNYQSHPSPIMQTPTSFLGEDGPDFIQPRSPVSYIVVKNNIKCAKQLRARFHKSQTLSGKLQNVKIAQTLAVSGPYRVIRHYVIHLSKNFLFRQKMTIIIFKARLEKNRVKLLVVLSNPLTLKPEDIHLLSAYFTSFPGFFSIISKKF